MWFLLVPAALAGPECPFGVNAHQASDDALDAAAAAGIGWVRFDFNWLQFEPEDDVFDWSVPDRFVDRAAANGLEVYATIGYTPAWAAGSPCDDLSPDPEAHCLTRLPSDVALWEDFVRQSVQRYGDRVRYWGIWNEPNLGHFFSGTRDEWVEQILRPASVVVRAECPDCFVVGPELANLREASWDADEGVCAFGECAFNGWNYSLEQILIDAGDAIDIVSHHKYGDPASGWWDEVLEGQSLLGVQYMSGVRELTDLYAPGKPVWLTEFGWETAPVGPYDPVYAADQLSTLFSALPDVRAGTFSAAAAWPELSALFWYDLHDDPSGPSWGLLDASLSPKPAYTAYTDTITALGGCAAFVPGTGTTGTGTTGTDTTDTTSTDATTATDGTATDAPGTDTPGTDTPGTDTTRDTASPDPAADTGGGEKPGEAGCACSSRGAPGGAATWGLILAAGLARRRAGLWKRLWIDGGRTGA